MAKANLGLKKLSTQTGGLHDTHTHESHAHSKTFILLSLCANESNSMTPDRGLL
jgi:hypothetical protein